jgi:hypothetical protein
MPGELNEMSPIRPLDPECCDGTDEWDSWVQCPNRCAEVGKKYRDALAAETKTRKTVGYNLIEVN